ncbi:nicotinate-nucleotide--dimethylbenzimidazole phosphoribosyltransferase [Streptomyces sp. NPDC017890]|uniref:nicotinate-nucleotide--dimethylbenzimidazole phosphoribosyltransferase n=1 Tax=Streptomyces sp. NPDC017890 TaxID=3365015 RepID=UPI00379E30DF
MTDTGQIPGEGLPENAGMVEQPGVPAPGAYTYLSETTAEDEDLLLLPGAQSAWGNEVAPPAPEPVVETVHQPGPHEMSGRDSGSVDLGGVRLPDPAPASAPVAPRRPLHLGPPIPDTSASPVRSLADRGPADAPVRPAGPQTTGPEYLDVPQATAMPPQGAAPWGAQAAPQAPGTPMNAGAVHAETVVPVPEQVSEHVPVRVPEPVGAAQALVTRVATEAVAATGGEAEAQAGDAPAFAETRPETVADDAGGSDAVPGNEVTYGPEAPAVGDAAHEPAAVAGTVADDVSAPQEAPAPEAAPAFVAPPAPEAGAEQAAEPAPAPAPEPAEEAVPAAPEAVASEPATEPVQEITEQPVPEDLQAAAEAAEAPGPEPVQAVEPAEAPEPQEAPLAEAPAVLDVQHPDDVPAVVQASDVAAPEPAHPQPSPEAPAAAPQPAPVQETAAQPEPAEAAHPQADAQAAPAEAAHPQPSPETPAAAPQPAPVQEAAAQPEPTVQPAPAEAAHPRPDAHAAPQDATASQSATQDATTPQPDVQPAPQDTTVSQPDGRPAAQDQPNSRPAAAHQPGGGPTAHQPGSGPTAHQPDPGGPQPAQGPQSLMDAGVPREADVPHSAPEPAETDTSPAGTVQPEAVHPDQAAGPHPDQAVRQNPDQAAGQYPAESVGQFVPVGGGQVPTTPRLAPAQPEAPVLPPQAQAAGQAPGPVVEVAVPGEADPELVQSVDDLDTHAADQEDPAAQAAEPAQAGQAHREAGEGQEDPHDVSTAAVAEVRQSAGPAAPAYDDAEREAVLKVMRERRDIRNGFRGDPIPHEVLLRVLEAAHTAPSVGHSQPWDFVVIRSADTRRTMHELATRQRDAYAKSLPKGRAKQFKELKIEAILDTPVNIVVTADQTRGGRHTLGRHTQPQMAPYSSALAVENLWLAARAEGLGVGWVSFFDEREMVRALGLPEHLDVVAYLCVGYVDEFPDEPELMQAGWSKRRPLSWVVHEETYGRRALPGEDPHDLLAETVAQIRPLDAKALGEAWERQKRMTKPAGALGMLEIISAQLSGLSRQCPPPIPEPAAVAVFAGDHGVHAQGVTPWPQEVTAQMVANFLGGGAVCNAFATQVGAEVCVVDVGVATDLPATPGLLPRKVRAGTSDMTAGPAMTREEAKQAIEVGIETARDLVAAGNKALLTGEMGIANTTASAALISVFTGADPAEVTGRGTGINDETLVRKTEVVRRAIELHQPDPADPIGVLAAVGGFEHAAMVGLLLGGASLRTPVILDGVSAGAAALVARAIAPEVLAACIAGHRSAEPGHVAALGKLGLRPLVDLDLRLGEGTGALLALPMVQSTARAMHEVATFDSAGVTEK